MTDAEEARRGKLLDKLARTRKRKVKEILLLKCAEKEISNLAEENDRLDNALACANSVADDAHAEKQGAVDSLQEALISYEILIRWALEAGADPGDVCAKLPGHIANKVQDMHARRVV